MVDLGNPVHGFGKSLPAWGVWIEISIVANHNGFRLSLPAWGVWIEID